MNYDKKHNNKTLKNLKEVLESAIHTLTVITGESTMKADEELKQAIAAGIQPDAEMAKNHLPLLMQNAVILMGAILLELLRDKTSKKYGDSADYDIEL